MSVYLHLAIYTGRTGGLAWEERDQRDLEGNLSCYNFEREGGLRNGGRGTSDLLPHRGFVERSAQEGRRSQETGTFFLFFFFGGGFVIFFDMISSDFAAEGFLVLKR